MEERYQPLKIPAVKISKNKSVDKNVSIDKNDQNILRQNGRKGKKIHCRILKATATKCAKGTKSNKSYRELTKYLKGQCHQIRMALK